MLASLSRAILAISITLLAMLFPAEAANVPYEYYRWYHDEPIELVEQPGKVLVIAPDGAELLTVQALVQSAGYRIADSNCPFTRGNRYCLQLQTLSGRQLTETRTVIDNLLAADSSGEYFFAPVFEGPIAPLQEILVSYEGELTESGLDDVIRAAGFSGEYFIVRQFDNGPYVIDPYLRSGIETLELGNAIKETGLVPTAGANFAFTGGGGPPLHEPIDGIAIPALSGAALGILAVLSGLTGGIFMNFRHSRTTH